MSTNAWLCAVVLVGYASVPSAAQVAAPGCVVEPAARSAGDLALSRVAAMAVDARGRIYVADIDRPEITVLGSDGALLGRLGRDGAGPGEFRNVLGITMLPGDSLFVFDQGLSRVSVFAPDSAKPAYVVNLAAGGLPHAPLRAMPVHEDRRIVALHERPADARGRSAGGQVVSVLDWDGRVLRDSLLSLPSSSMMILARSDRRLVAGGNPFGRPMLVRVGPDGRIYYGWGETLAIRVYVLDGEPVGGFSIDHRGPRIGRAEASRIMEDVAPSLREAVREHMPDRWPAFRNFEVDGAGRIWVGLVQPEAQPTRWVAFGPDGQPLCEAAFPPRFAPKAFRDDMVYGFTLDALDVPIIEVFRVGVPGPDGR